jgi:hypothetical protein
MAVGRGNGGDGEGEKGEGMEEMLREKRVKEWRQ